MSRCVTDSTIRPPADSLPPRRQSDNSTSLVETKQLAITLHSHNSTSNATLLTNSPSNSTTKVLLRPYNTTSTWNESMIAGENLATVRVQVPLDSGQNYCAAHIPSKHAHAGSSIEYTLEPCSSVESSSKSQKFTYNTHSGEIEPWVEVSHSHATLHTDHQHTTHRKHMIFKPIIKTVHVERPYTTTRRHIERTTILRYERPTKTHSPSIKTITVDAKPITVTVESPPKTQTQMVDKLVTVDHTIVSQTTSTETDLLPAITRLVTLPITVPVTIPLTVPITEVQTAFSVITMPTVVTQVVTEVTAVTEIITAPMTSGE